MQKEKCIKKIQLNRTEFSTKELKFYELEVVIFQRAKQHLLSMLLKLIICNDILTVAKEGIKRRNEIKRKKKVEKNVSDAEFNSKGIKVLPAYNRYVLNCTYTSEKSKQTLSIDHISLKF